MFVGHTRTYHIYIHIYIYCLIVGYIYSTIREYKIYIHSFLFEYVHFGLLNHRPHSCIICSPWVGLSSLPHVVCPTSCRSADAWKTSGDPSGTGWGPQKSVQLLHGALTMLHGRFMEVPPIAGWFISWIFMEHPHPEMDENWGYPHLWNPP